MPPIIKTDQSNGTTTIDGNELTFLTLSDVKIIVSNAFHATYDNTKFLTELSKNI